MGFYGYGGSGYYMVPGPGGYLDAKAYLNGPGTHAYLQQGPNSSYAYEGQNGSVFEQNTTTFNGGYEQSTSYVYSNGYYEYSHYSETTHHSPPIYRTTGGFGYTMDQPTGYYGPYGSPYGPGQISLYTVSDVEVYTDGSYSTQSFQSASEAVYAGGYYRDSYSSRSGSYSDGHLIPGSATSYSTTSYGYFSSYSG